MKSEPGISTNRRLIIHCGVQKTGSTSLHHFVARNQLALAEKVTVLTPVKGSLTRELGRTAMQFSLTPTDDLALKLEQIATRLRDAVADTSGPVLLSHENLPGAMLGNGGVTTLYPRLPDILTILDRSFAPLVPEYVFYTRDMDGWKNSVYGQAVRSDRYPRTRAEFLSEVSDCGTWEHLERKLRAILGPDRPRFFRLEDETDDRRPAQQLLRFAGLNERDIAALAPVSGRKNQSLNSGALEFLRLVNGLDLERKARRRIAELVSSQQSLFVSGQA